MKTQSRKIYSSRFTVLTDPPSVETARKNYLIWIITGSILFCISAAYFYYKIVLVPPHLNDQVLESTTAAAAVPQESEFKLYNPKPMLLRLKNRKSEYCEESQPQLQAIPPIFIEQIFQSDFENIHDYIGLDLLLHYENIINEFRPSYLKSIFNEYQSKWMLMRNSRDFVNFLRILNSSKFIFYADYLKRKELDIKRFQSYFVLTEELSQWYNYLDRLGRFLSGYEQQKLKRYFENCTERNFEKYVTETQKRLFSFVYPFNVTEKKLAEVNEVINDWSSPVKIEFFNFSVLFYSRVILLSQINELLLQLNISGVKTVEIFAPHIIYMDEDLELFGVNLVIISPTWVFVKKIKINLNGIKGEDIMEVSAYNESGKPGNPGGNAGDFLGVGNLQEKFLQISANGGKGGKGQDGGKGRDGIDNSFPAPPVDKPSCAIKINSFNNSFRQKITHYKIYNEEGCGKPGMVGGVGGRGGEGGVITLIAKEGVKVRKGLKGSVGLPGKGGKGGAGGRNGCFYEVFDVDDEILHRVTRVKCPMGNLLPNGEFGKDNYNTRGQILPPAKVNLKIGNSLFQFIRVVGKALITCDDVGVVSFLKDLNQHSIGQHENVADIISEYKTIKELKKIEFFDVFKEKITRYMQQPSDNATQSILKHLKTAVLGEMTILKKNINYFFIDFKNYLNILKKSIKNTNESVRDLQSVSYLKQKVEIKLRRISENLKWIRSTVLDMKEKGRRNFLCFTMTAIDTIHALVNRSRDLKTSELDELCSGSTNQMEKDDQIPRNLTKEERNVFKALGKVANKSQKEIRGQLVNLKTALSDLKDSDVFSDDEKKVLQDLIDELEHFMALYYFKEWEEMENLFFKSLGNLTESSAWGEEIKFLKNRLVELLVGLQYKMAVDATRQNLNHFINTNALSHLFQINTTIDDASTQINYLQDLVDRDSFCKNHLKAVFERDSAVGEFYFWRNEEIRKELENLFSGAEINLKSSLINRHVFDKNYLRFTSIKLEFECSKNQIVCEKKIHEILSNFKIEITHSGYSYYNWKGETHIVVSERLSLEYSYRKRGNGKPEVYNALFKKCQDGEVKLSPFTTWSIRLLPLNSKADFSGLSTFAHSVNIRLTGTGNYIS